MDDDASTGCQYGLERALVRAVALGYADYPKRQGNGLLFTGRTVARRLRVTVAQGAHETAIGAAYAAGWMNAYADAVAAIGSEEEED